MKLLETRTKLVIRLLFVDVDNTNVEDDNVNSTTGVLGASQK